MCVVICVSVVRVNDNSVNGPYRLPSGRIWVIGRSEFMTQVTLEFSCHPSNPTIMDVNMSLPH